MPARHWLKLEHHFVFDTRFRQAADRTDTSYGLCQGVALACACLDNQGKQLGPLDLERLAWSHRTAIEVIRKVVRALTRLGFVARRLISSLRKPRDREKHRLAQARYRRKKRLDPRQLTLLLPITGGSNLLPGPPGQQREHRVVIAGDHAAAQTRDHHHIKNNDLSGDHPGRADHSVITRDHHHNKINDIALENGITRDHPRSPRDHHHNGNNGLARKTVDHRVITTPLLEKSKESEEKTRTCRPAESESQSPTHTLAALSAQPARALIDREFKETFWPAYPDTSKRHAAAKEFRGARMFAALDRIMTGLAAYKRAKPDWQQWAHAATWLRGRRWEDAPAAAAAPAEQQPHSKEEHHRAALTDMALAFDDGRFDPFESCRREPELLAEFISFYRALRGCDPERRAA